MSADATTQLAVQVLLVLIEQAPRLAEMIQRGVTKAELQALAAADDAERERLQAAIEARQGTTTAARGDVE